MENKEDKNPVHDEHINNSEESVENTENTSENTDENAVNVPEANAANEQPAEEQTGEESHQTDEEVSKTNEASEEPAEEEKPEPDEAEQAEAEQPDESAYEAEEEVKAEESSQGEEHEEGEEDKKEEEAEAEAEKKEEDKDDIGNEEQIEIIDYTVFDKQQLVEKMTELIHNRPVQKVRMAVEEIKNVFYKKYKAEREAKRNEFIEKGGNPEEFKPADDVHEQNIRELLKLYKERRIEYGVKLEEKKKENLAEKYHIIDEIKELVNRKESINKTFQEFRELQNRWRELGLVPQKNLKDLWETYHHHVEKFYDYIKINKELRDLDLKKNLEHKIKLCEKAEELLLEDNVVNAFRELQKYHDQWREIGPVPRDKKNELWERFKAATAKINKRHQEFFINLKDSQKKNFEAKTHLCEQAEELINDLPETHKDWEEKSGKLIELQKIWKTIGFAPKKDNNKIYARFREACDTFFNAKREFYAQTKDEQKNNLQLKTDLCIQAEALKESTEWKKTTEEYIKLQKRWKEIGPVPKKHSDVIWKRFRTACDFFFDKKSDFFSNVDEKYGENLRLKEELIEKVTNYQVKDDVKASLKELKDFQREWAEIGFVPFKDKDRVQQQFREAINQKFDELHIDEQKKNVMKYRNKLDSLQDSPRADFRMHQDREKFYNKIKQLENDITLWENNIGFFANSKNAQSMINEVEKKIESAKKRIKVLEQKIRLIDEASDE